MTPTKADPLYERMVHAFGEKCIGQCFDSMLRSRGGVVLHHLTDEARDELLRRCIGSHRLQRKFAAESRKHYREKVAR